MHNGINGSTRRGACAGVGVVVAVPVVVIVNVTVCETPAAVARTVLLALIGVYGALASPLAFVVTLIARPLPRCESRPCPETTWKVTLTLATPFHSHQDSSTQRLRQLCVRRTAWKRFTRNPDTTCLSDGLRLLLCWWLRSRRRDCNRICTISRGTDKSAYGHLSRRVTSRRLSRAIKG